MRNKTMIETLQYEIAHAMCKAYDIGKNDGTLKELNDKIQEVIFKEQKECFS